MDTATLDEKLKAYPYEVALCYRVILHTIFSLTKSGVTFEQILSQLNFFFDKEVIAQATEIKFPPD